MAARKTISQRIALTGGDEIKQNLLAMGKAGEKAFDEIQAAADKLKGPGADFARRMDAIQKKVREVGESVKEAGEKMRNFGAGLSVAVTAPVGLLGRSFLQAASDAQEARSAFDEVFGGSSDAVRDWSRVIAKDLGRGTQVIQDQAASFQQLFAQVAPSHDAATALSQDFTVLAQDLSSFFNVTESDALAKLQSGLSGSAEPLRAFGVFINENAVKAKAFELGLGGVNGELTDQEKVLARAAIIMEQTSKAQGDASRTSESYANQLKRLQGLWQDLSITLGEVIMPVALQVVQFFADMVETIQNLPKPMQTLIVALAGLAALLGPIIASVGLFAMGIGGLVTGFAGLLPALVGVSGAIAALGGTLTAALGPALAFVGWPALLAAAIGALAVVVYRNWDEIVSYLADVFEAILFRSETFAMAFQARWESLWSALGAPVRLFKDAFFMVWDQIADHIKTKTDWIRNVVGSMIDWASAKLKALRSALGSLTGGDDGDSGSGGTVMGPSTLFKGFAGGGRVSGPGSSMSDSILARLSDGEFVVRAQAVKHYGSDLFRRLNSMRFPDGGLLGGYASGGLVSGSTVPVAAGPSGSDAAMRPFNLSIGGESFGGLMAPRETADRLVRFALHEEAKSAGRRPAWFKGG